MPKAAARKKPVFAPVQPVAPVAPVVPQPTVQVQSTSNIANPDNLPVIFDKVEIDEYSTTSKKGPLTVEKMKKMFGWETEKEWQQRMVSEKGGKPENYQFGDTGPVLSASDGGGFQPIHCRNLAGEKVVCWNNAHNRPFDESWCESLVHTILYGQWAGPHTIPGETINGETIRVSRYGRVISGQHQGTALIMAADQLEKDRKLENDTDEDPKYPIWKGHKEPFLETIVVRGLSEHPQVLMSVDYVKPRTAADVFYTSEVFKQCTPPERKELCRILASAVDMLWTRTSARGYKTHPEIVAFLERHRRLLKCVEHLFNENSQKAGRRISKLRLQPGTCAAVSFIMASSGPETDGDSYRNEFPPTEKNLDWSYWDKAELFWTMLTGSIDFKPVRTALGRLVDSTPENELNQGLGGRGPEKLAILAKAWEIYREHPDNAGPAFSEDDLIPGGALCLSYSNLDDKGNKLPEGDVKLLDVADFYGVDCPEEIGNKTKQREPDPILSKEEVEAAIEEARLRKTGGK